MAPRVSWQKAAHFITHNIGILVTLGVYGLLQEKILATPYGENDYFTCSAFLVLCNRLVGIAYAAGMLSLRRQSFELDAPFAKYAAVSCSNVASTWCQYEALLYVSFPVQMMAKTFKMLPVMLWGMVVARKRYGVRDWLVALVVTQGIAQFVMTGSIKADHSAQRTSEFGLLLMFAFLVFDGFTSTWQELLFSKHSTTQNNQMLYVNVGSTAISGVFLLFSGQAVGATGFILKHPLVLADTLLLSLVAVLAQIFIYAQVQEFGALMLAAAMNLRQVVSIVLSYIVYQHPMSPLQVLAVVLVFSALFYKVFADLSSGGAEAPPPPQRRISPSRQGEPVGRALPRDGEAEKEEGAKITQEEELDALTQT